MEQSDYMHHSSIFKEDELRNIMHHIADFNGHLFTTKRLAHKSKVSNHYIPYLLSHLVNCGCVGIFSSSTHNGGRKKKYVYQKHFTRGEIEKYLRVMRRNYEMQVQTRVRV